MSRTPAPTTTQSTSGYWQPALPGLGEPIWIAVDKVARRRGLRLRAETDKAHPMNPRLSLTPLTDDTTDTG
jgi:hypothetical protein